MADGGGTGVCVGRKRGVARPGGAVPTTGCFIMSSFEYRRIVFVGNVVFIRSRKKERECVCEREGAVGGGGGGKSREESV
jgi:hypothetical protein